VAVTCPLNQGDRDIRTTVSLAITAALVAPAHAVPLLFQDWSDTGLISANDDWSAFGGQIVGYRGDGLTSSTGVDPQTVLADGTGTPVDVNANQTNPNTFTTGGVAEFQIANPTIALNGSNTADAPFLLVSLSTTGFRDITVSYLLRDLDGSADNALSPIALHYRIGNSGDFSNVGAAFVADASAGPNLSGPDIPVSATLPGLADDLGILQLRIMTTNSPGNDEWIGIDDIRISGTRIASLPEPSTLALLSAMVLGMGFVTRRCARKR
jgi:hypothetical protein